MLKINTKCDDYQREELASHNLSIGNVKHKLQFYTVASNNDFIWLSPNVIQQFDRWGHEKIGLLNNDFDLETGIIQWSNDMLCKITECFSETLYFLYMFLNGHLMGSPLSHRVHYGYFANMHNVLLELCIRGVYVIEGVEPVRGKTPSQCAFIVLIRDEVTIPFINMMESINAHNINVNACRIKARKVLLHYNNNKNNRVLGTFKVDTSIVCERLDMRGCIGMSENNQLIGRNGCNFSLWHVKIWNQSVQDYVHVEDMLLHLWIKFNSMYGYANNDMLMT
jgi:hypothetical protein